MNAFFIALYISAANLLAQSSLPVDIKNIHGKFLREQVTDLTEFKHQVTGLIYDLKTKAACTGTLIGPRHVLTAAHCVFNFQTKEWSEDLTFSPGKLSKDDIGKGTFKYKKIFLQKEYLENSSEDYDFALIELDSAVGETIGWVGFRSLKKEELLPDYVHNVIFAGYPGDKDFGSLWEVSCPASIKEKLLTYSCDSYGGMSGSALFVKKDSQNFVIGIHTFGGPEKNGGVYLDSKNYVMINAWKNLTKYSSNTVIHYKK